MQYPISDKRPVDIKNKRSDLFGHFSAEAGGFEPPVQLPVRQFSKLVVSATHPHFLKPQSAFR